MALSDLQKHEIIRYLGWSGKTLIQDSTHYNSIVNSRLDNLNTIIEGQVTGILARLAKIEEQLTSALCRLTAEKVGDIVTNPKEISMLRKEFLRWIKELSDLLDIKIVRSGINKNIGVTV